MGSPLFAVVFSLLSFHKFPYYLSVFILKVLLCFLLLVVSLEALVLLKR